MAGYGYGPEIAGWTQLAPKGSTYIAVEEGAIRGASDGSLFNPFQGADLAHLPGGDEPAAALKRLDGALLPAAKESRHEGGVARALGLPFAIEHGVIKVDDLPPFAGRTPAYTKSGGADRDGDGIGWGY